jgi:hypothetical protein
MSSPMQQFFGHTPVPPGGSSAWAAGYGRDLRDVIVRQAHRQPRSVQRHLGPSELGAECDRQVVSKMCGEPVTNHVSDPWPSVVGTAVHAWLAEKFDNENRLNGRVRWLTEEKVMPHPLYPGTSDVYDVAEQAVVDWKILGPTSLAKLQAADGPPQRYVIQLLLYAWGWRNHGFPVRRVAIAGLPRTAPSLAEMYVWDRFLTPADDQAVIEILQLTEARRAVARMVLGGQLPISQVKRTPGGDECYFCNFYRPETARDPSIPGCPGHSAPASWQPPAMPAGNTGGALAVV